MKTLSILIISSMLTAALLTACSGGEERKTAYLEHGKELFAAGNLVKARLELKNALQIDPKIPEAHFLLGRIAENNQDWRAAFGQYKAAIDLKADYIEAKVSLGRIYLLGGENELAMEQAEGVLASNQSHADALMLKAMVQSRQDALKEAIATLKPVVDGDDNNIEAVIILASFYQKDQQTDRARALLKTTIRLHPDDARPYMALAQIELKDDPDESERLVRKVIDMSPDDFTNRVRLSTLMQQRGKVKEAETVLLQGIKEKPDDYQRIQILARFYMSTGQNSKAEKLLKDAVGQSPDSADRRFGLAVFYTATARINEAMGIYQKLISETGEGPDWIKASNALAEILLSKRDSEGSKDLISKVLEDNPKNRNALMIKGKIALLQHDPESAIADFRQILRDDPNSIPVMKFLAEAQMANKQVELASDNIDRVIELAPADVAARVAKTKLLIATGANKDAIKAARDALKVLPDNLSVLEQLLTAQMAIKDWPGATDSAEKLIRLAPDKAAGYLQLGRIYAQQNKREPALKAFEKATEVAPDEPAIWGILLRADAAMNHLDRAIGRMKKLIAGNPKHPFAHELLGELYTAQGKNSEAESSFLKAINIKPNWQIPVIKLATLYQATGKPESAIGVYQNALKHTETLPLVIKLAELYVTNGQFDKSVKLYRSTLERHPEADVIVNNLASILARMSAQEPGLLDEALSLAKAFSNSENAYFLDTLSWVYYLKGDIDQALPVVRKAVEKSGGNLPVIQYHLGMMLDLKGDTQGALEALSKATAQGANYPGIEEARKKLSDLQG